MSSADEPFPIESSWDLRRKSWAHFHSRAHEARINAHILYHFDPEVEKERFGSSTTFAIKAGFRREASISIELIIKSLLCLQKDKKPKAIHDVFELWRMANLPSIDDDGNYRLVLISETLYWSGRYPAPVSDDYLSTARERLEQYSRKDPKMPMIRKVTPFRWDDFDALYQIVNDEILEIVGDDSGKQG